MFNWPLWRSHTCNLDVIVPHWHVSITFWDQVSSNSKKKLIVKIPKTADLFITSGWWKCNLQLTFLSTRSLNVEGIPPASLDAATWRCQNRKACIMSTIELRPTVTTIAGNVYKILCCVSRCPKAGIHLGRWTAEDIMIYYCREYVPKEVLT